MRARRSAFTPGDCGVDDLDTLRIACDRALTGHGPARAADLLATISPDTARRPVRRRRRGGRAGGGGRRRPRAARRRCSCPAGRWPSRRCCGCTPTAGAAGPWCSIPSATSPARGPGVRAAARADRAAGRRSVAGCSPSPTSTAVAELPAALLLELPQRDLGGQLPAWDDLVAQVAWARERGAAVHLDGARLWEASAFYDRSPAEIADALRHRVRVLLQGARRAGRAAAWPARRTSSPRSASGGAGTGGTLFGLWPGAASALDLPPAPAAADARLPAAGPGDRRRGARRARRHGRPRSAADADDAPAATRPTPDAFAAAVRAARRGRALDLGAGAADRRPGRPAGGAAGRRRDHGALELEEIRTAIATLAEVHWVGRMFHVGHRAP